MRNKRNCPQSVSKKKCRKLCETERLYQTAPETCNSWGGPCVTSDELIATIDAKLGKQEQIVMTELTFYRNIHKSDIIARPDLH